MHTYAHVAHMQTCQQEEGLRDVAAQEQDHVVYNMMLDTTRFTVRPKNDGAAIGVHEVAAQHGVLHHRPRGAQESDACWR